MMVGYLHSHRRESSPYGPSTRMRTFSGVGPSLNNCGSEGGKGDGTSKRPFLLSICPPFYLSLLRSSIMGTHLVLEHAPTRTEMQRGKRTNKPVYQGVKGT
jgi:hypothetical protein